MRLLHRLHPSPWPPPPTHPEVADERNSQTRNPDETSSPSSSFTIVIVVSAFTIVIVVSAFTIVIVVSAFTIVVESPGEESRFGRIGVGGIGRLENVENGMEGFGERYRGGWALGCWPAGLGWVGLGWVGFGFSV
ncbi:hypothetical protein MANES_16G048770v8 [Manihot esculenta]|uniref:Uncharacterized protein n=1 Tax=Manihot esculenta TaxID=3983 RepID=A0ACB7G5Z8_MANES|nr:hypothetical protein MANES_16G048770v8 [Manihot esculenta]